MESGQKWYTWVFSGIGVFVISILFGTLLKAHKSKSHMTKGDNSPVIDGKQNKITIQNGNKKK